MPTPQPPSADVVFDTLFAYQQSAALKAALDLDLFSVIEVYRKNFEQQSVLWESARVCVAA